MKLRVGVSGSSGFIGRHVMARLAAAGHEPLALRRPFDRTVLGAAFRGLDAVVHLAGVVAAVDDRDFIRGNVDATRLVAGAAREAGVRLVHISSLAAAGPAPASAPRAEDDPAAPITIYGRTKLAGEVAIRDLPGLDWTILRPGVVYGPGDRALLPLFRYARRGILPLVGAPSAAYTFIYIDDAVCAIIAAVERGTSGDIIFVGHPAPVTPRLLLEAISRTLGAGAAPVRVPRALTWLAARAGDAAGRWTGRPFILNTRRFAELYAAGFVCRVERMTERLGVAASVDLRDGLSRAARWYEEQGWL